MLNFIKTLYDLGFGATNWRDNMRAFLSGLDQFLGNAKGSRGSIAERMDEGHNPDGSHKTPVTASSLWSEETNTFIRLGNLSFKTTSGGDRTGVYTPGRAVRDNAGNIFVVAVSSWSDPDTTVALIGNAPLAATLSKIEYGQEVANGPIRNLGPIMAAKALAYGNMPGSL